MLYLLTALFYEAKPYIKLYWLKRIPAPGGIQLFEGDSRLLAVSGAGPVNAAAAAVYMLTRYPPGRADVFINIGAAGSSVFNIGEIVLCHKITNTFTGKDLYPDMLYRHPFREGILGTAGRISSESDYELTDMEGAFIYEAAQKFLPSAQIHCIKVISDSMRPTSVNAEGLEALMSETAEAVHGWLESLAEEDMSADVFTDEENHLIDLISEHLRLTFAMARKLKKVCGQAKTRGLDMSTVLLEYSQIVSRGKREGKDIYAKLIERMSEGV